MAFKFNTIIIQQILNLAVKTSTITCNSRKALGKKNIPKTERFKRKRVFYRQKKKRIKENE